MGALGSFGDEGAAEWAGWHRAPRPDTDHGMAWRFLRRWATEWAEEGAEAALRGNRVHGAAWRNKFRPTTLVEQVRRRRGAARHGAARRGFSLG